jgi:glycosyltransferase involved in cell wall biosynthesis
MQVSFVVPAYNEESYIGDCLDSIICHAAGHIHEIIVVDNASTDQTSEIARSRLGVRVVSEPRRGVNYARQHGLEDATGNILAYLDADTRLSPTWMSIAEREFEHCDGLVCLSGPYRFYDGPTIKRWLLNAICWSAFRIAYQLFGFMIVGGNFVATKEAIIEAGGFDQTIDFYGDDTDLGRRLRLRRKTGFRTDFFIFASGRRYYALGLVRTSTIYLLNFFWVILFHRPFSVSHIDVRTQYPKG